MLLARYVGVVAFAVMSAFDAGPPGDRAPRPVPDDAGSTVDPAVEASRAAFDRGTTMYETQRFDEAIDAFTEAFTQAAEIEDDDLRARSASTMLFNLARAHLGAFGVDRNVEHLRQAERLMIKYREGEREAGRDPDSDVDMRRLEREIAAAMASVEARQEPETEPEPGPNRRLLWAGVGTAAASSLGLGVMAGGLAVGQRAESDYRDEPSGSGRADLDARGRTANIVAIAGGATAGALVVIGAGLIGAAYLRKDDTQDRRAARLTVSPALGRDGAGVVLGGRF